MSKFVQVKSLGFKMAAKGALQTGLKQVKPILSTNKLEAKRRVLNLYKAWYRHIPFMGKNSM